MSEDIYGCYMGNYKKHYKWQCKLFDNVEDATNFCIDGKTKNETQSSLLVIVNPITPNILRPMVIQNSIKKITCEVDIIE